MHISYHLTPRSRNAKTGPIPVSTSSANTCPPTCPYNNGGGCYAESGPLAIHWRKVSRHKRGTGLAEFCAKIAKLADGQLWRHNQAGDLPVTDYGTIDAYALDAIVSANRGKRGFTYTHHDLSAAPNLLAVKAANERGFAINVSANNLRHADELSDICEPARIPVVVVLAESAQYRASVRTPAGRKVIVCPATRPGSAVTCESCGLCAQRRHIIGFPVHGAGKRKAEKTASA